MEVSRFFYLRFKKYIKICSFGCSNLCHFVKSGSIRKRRLSVRRIKQKLTVIDGLFSKSKAPTKKCPKTKVGFVFSKRICAQSFNRSVWLLNTFMGGRTRGHSKWITTEPHTRLHIMPNAKIPNAKIPNVP